MEDHKKMINSVVFDRLTNPLTSTFLISWVVSNWNLFYITFFVYKYDDGMNKIDYLISKANSFHILELPLIYTGFLLFIYPLLVQWTYENWLELKQKRLDVKNKYDRKKTFTLEEYSKLIEQPARDKISHSKIIAELNQEHIVALETVRKQHEDETQTKILYETKMLKKKFEKEITDLKLELDKEHTANFVKRTLMLLGGLPSTKEIQDLQKAFDIGRNGEINYEEGERRDYLHSLLEKYGMRDPYKSEDTEDLNNVGALFIQIKDELPPYNVSNL